MNWANFAIVLAVYLSGSFVAWLVIGVAFRLFDASPARKNQSDFQDQNQPQPVIYYDPSKWTG